MECAKKADIWNATMLSFGGLLGYCRENHSIIGHDNDLDLIIRSDLITIEQEDAFFKYCEEKGLFRYRKKVQINPITGRFFWFSLRAFPNHTSWKCCHWFNFLYKGYSFHCKGTNALVKGIPANYLEIGPAVEYLGSEIHIPKYPGACLDFWYPDWATSRSGGNSSKKILLNIPDWQDEETWKLHIGEY